MCLRTPGRDQSGEWAEAFGTVSDLWMGEICAFCGHPYPWSAPPEEVRLKR